MKTVTMILMVFRMMMIGTMLKQKQKILRMKTMMARMMMMMMVFADDDGR